MSDFSKNSVVHVITRWDRVSMRTTFHAVRIVHIFTQR